MTANRGMLLSEHPEYYEKKLDWQEWSDFYDGKHRVLTSNPSYFWLHDKEEADSNQANSFWAKRAIRTRYLNFPEIIASLWISFFFNKKPQLDAATKALLEDAEDNIDGKKSSLYTFIKDALIQQLVFGKSILLVDSLPFQATSRLEEVTNGLRPYMSLINPLAVKDWEYESADPARVGEINFLRYEYLIVLPRRDETEPPKQIWYSDSLKMVDGKYAVTRYKRNSESQKGSITPTGTGESWEVETPLIQTKLDRVPVTIWEKGEWLKDVIEETKSHFNIRSAMDNTLHYQAYDRVFVSGNISPDAKKTMGENIVTLLPEGSNVTNIPPVDTGSLERRISAAVDAVFKVGLNRLRLLPSDSRMVQGDATLQEEDKNTKELVEATLEDLENFMEHGLNDFSLFKTGKPYTGKFALDKTVTQKSVDDFLKVYSAIKDRISSEPDIDRPALKRLVTELGFADKEQEKALKAIDSIEQAPSPQDQLVASRKAAIGKALGG